MAYATPADVAARWRPLTPAEVEIATALLEDATVEIDATCPPADPPTDLPARKVVACRMVRRVMVAGVTLPGVSQQSQSAGALSASFTFANPSGDMYLTKADRRLLGCGQQRAFTVSMWPDEEGVDASILGL